ncbi:MAG: hypothetical protein WC047_05105 [Kiritimatiellales bacterium]
MKIIGRTETGARLLEISTEEIIALAAAAQALASITLNIAPAELLAGGPDPDQSSVGAELARARPIRKNKAGRRSPGRACPEPACGESVERVEGPAGKVIRPCVICTKPLPKNAHPLMKCHKGECLKLYKRKQAREWFRAKHGVKNFRKLEDFKKTVSSDVNPASPFLSDEQRAELHAKRTAILKAAVDKHKYDDVT